MWTNLAGATLVVALPAQAAVELRGPPACGSQADLNRQLAGVGVAPEALAGVEGQVEIEAQETGWHLLVSLEVAGTRAERTLSTDAPSCEPVLEAAALLISLSLPSNEPEPEPEPEPESESARTPVPLLVPTRLVAPSSETRSETTSTSVPVRFLARVAVGVEAGPLPTATGCAGAGAGVAYGGFDASLSGVACLPSTESFAGEEGAGGTFALYRGLVEVCYRLGDRFAIGACASAEAGAVVARGTGIASPREASQPWLAAGAGPSLSWQLTRALHLVLDARALVSMTRPRFAVEERGELHRPAAATGRGSLAVDWRFP